MHGDLRVGVEYCAMCHNPSQTDINRRPGDKLPPETVNFKQLIHSIHTGEELETDYTVYGFGNRAHDFTEVRFPGDRRECSICHEGNSYELPLADEVLPTIIPDGIASDDTVFISTIPDMQATRAACTSCHDAPLVGFHALFATVEDPVTMQQVETCAICHGPGRDFDVALVHLREP